MDPPRHVGWLQLDLDRAGMDGAQDPTTPLFDPVFTVPNPEASLSDVLLDSVRSLNLTSLTNDEGILNAASLLERAVNNTSLFLVLEVGDTRLVFPGDAQHGPWKHVLDTPAKRALVAEAAFYKIGRHGSHNATPKTFVEQVWRTGAHAMLPWGLVKRWQETITKQELMAALAAHHHTVTRADAPTAIPGVITVHEDL